MKIFMDTNVLVSALFSASGSCAEVFRTVSKSKRFRLAIMFKKSFPRQLKVVLFPLAS